MFKNKGQKPGKGQKALKKEKKAPLSPVDAKLHKISKSMLAAQKATGDATMRAQLNG